ncbi:MAG: hypothetical protein HQM14_04080 [SAR324 cluster bacterium]|nr:hypothetical protein [SAR324 cluster bacterium]
MQMNNENQLLFTGIAFALLLVYFGLAEVKSRGGYQSKATNEQKIEIFRLSVIRAWNTKYHWGIILEAVLLVYIIYIQI